MADDLPDKYSDARKSLLALFEISKGPVPEEIVKDFIHIDPDQFSLLIDQWTQKGWIQRLEIDGRATFSLGVNPPRGPGSVHRCSHLPQLIESIKRLGIDGNLSLRKTGNLLAVLERGEDTASYFADCARKAAGTGNYRQAFRLMQLAVMTISSKVQQARVQNRALFDQLVLELDDFSILSGEEDLRLANYLKAVQTATKQSNHVRSHALAMLKRGWRILGQGKYSKGMSLLAEGKKIARALGDEDILDASALYLIVYEMNRGRYDQALACLERAEGAWDIENGVFSEKFHPMMLRGTLMWIRGEFNLAVGSMESLWHLARKNGNFPIAAEARANHALFMAYIGKRQEALRLIEDAKSTLEQSSSPYISILLAFARARLHLNSDRSVQAYQILRPILTKVPPETPLHHTLSGLAPEYIMAFHRQGFEPISGWGLHRLINRLWTNPNIHIQGAALRMRAETALYQGASYPQIDMDLARSEELLQKAGALRHLALTWITMARKCIQENDLPNARKLVQKAKSVFSRYKYAETLFPAELQYLIDKPQSFSGNVELEEHILERYLDFIENLFPTRERSKLYDLVLKGANRVFGTERGALFGFDPRQPLSLPSFEATYNMTEQEIIGSGFNNSLDMARQAFISNAPLINRKERSDANGKSTPVKSRFFIPFQTGNGRRKILYLENQYLKNPFERLQLPMLEQIARRTGRFIGRLENKVDTGDLETRASIGRESSRFEVILTQSPEVLDVLDQADRTAVSSSTVLILGETGTGKELLAGRIHRISRRSEGPFIVVDAATIPETILESELFGHEKGAFTGAERRKKGLVEMADGGTLFVDEIGELPLTMQTKLLRTFENKTFRRVGGIQSHASNFRLVAATNRNLADEVEKGRFRQDLFYRLNVVTLELPPLRERGDDIVLLAGHFLKKYVRQSEKTGLRLTAKQEKELGAYTWTGNIRELKNVMERAVILSSDGRLMLDLPSKKPHATENPFRDAPTMEELQRRYIRYVLKKTDGRISGPKGAAVVLGMKRQTLTARMKRLGMR